jgi:3',5'-cyclic-AMP phosphodiesterase
MNACMERPFLLVQLSDPHIGATWAETDPVAETEPAAGFAAAIDGVLALGASPDAVLVTGDLADHAADGEYEQVRALLGRIDAPSYVLPGNHDDRDALHRHFDVPGAGGEPVQYAVDLGPLQLVVLDSTIPGEDGGALEHGQLGWLDETLAAAPDMPAVVAMHHPPFLMGIPPWDAIALRPEDRERLGEVLARHACVERVLVGHVHRAISTELGGRAVMSVPSTYVQGLLDFRATELALSDDPPGFAVHTLVGGRLVSHVQPVRA